MLRCWNFGFWLKTLIRLTTWWTELFRCLYSISPISLTISGIWHTCIYCIKVFPCIYCNIWYQDNSPTNQLAVSQVAHGLDNSRTGQLAEMFDLKFEVYNSSKCYFRQIALFICCQYSIRLELGLGLGLMYKLNIVIPWFLKIRCWRVDQSASYPLRELVCRRVVL